MSVHTLVRIDGREISDDQGEVRAFMNVRDEIVRLPQCFDHCRRIGVSRFFVTDNGSTDGSKEFLLAQPDCHVFVTSNSYAESISGLDWQMALLNEYGTNRWCLTVDADEWFVYPGYESMRLSELAAYLAKTGAQGMFAFLLDMYSPASIADSAATPECSLLDICRYFDSEYVWHRRFYIPGIQRPPCPEYNLIGGPRQRLFYPNFDRYGYLMRLLWRGLGRRSLKLPANLRPPPTLTKIPFVHWLPGTRYENPHFTGPIKLSTVTGALLHFKFLPDFYARIRVEANRKQHWNSAAEHERYLRKLKRNPSSLTFFYSGSLPYQSSEQLVQLGLLKEDQGWMRRRNSRIDDKINGRITRGA